MTPNVKFIITQRAVHFHYTFTLSWFERTALQTKLS